MRNYFQLLRVHHWIKNILVFIPLFFSFSFFDASVIKAAVLGFFSFSLLSSIVYILNDIRDMEKDRQHSSKCRRPLASGEIPVSRAVVLLAILTAVLIVLLVLLQVYGNRLFNLKSVGLMLLYMALNIAYSWGLKNIPIVDVTILASGYVIRVLFGSLIIGVNTSLWLYLVITLGAYYMGLGKRRNEITGSETGGRAVMKFYSHNFLDKNMYVCQALCVVFYALWSIDPVTVERFNTTAFIYTIPVILIIFLKYSLNIETDTDGDPTSVLLGDKVLLSLCVLYAVCAFSIIYLNRAAP
ncbi:MAG: UbiA prenyltransferase family protein [Treponema sp.]|jgi:4-hydroxybenzoate polyprenyltransferase|nr:UbiA prenyltransferase family protein [Treponema sp.]